MDDRIRVLSVCTTDDSGGAAKAAYRIHRAVQAFGVNSRMFVKIKETNDPDIIALQSFIPTSPFYRSFDILRTKVQNKWQHFVWGRYPDREPYFMSDLRSTDIHAALRHLDYDILHLHWINLRFLPLKELPQDKPIVWTLHDSWPFCGICHFFLNCDRYKDECGCCPMLHSYKRNDLSHRVWKEKNSIYQRLNLHIVTPSKWLADCVRESGLLKRFPVKVIPNGLDTSIFRPDCVSVLHPAVLSFLKSQEGKSIVVFGAVGATTDRLKGVEKLVEAFQVLHDENKTHDLALVVFGSNKPIKGLPSEISVHYTGYLHSTDEIVSLYNIASVVVVPSFSEVFGQVASESLACGTPVVAFRCTGIQEVVNNRCGYLADPYDAKDFAYGIRWCIENNKDGRLSHIARQRVLDNYTTIGIGKQYAELYSDVMQSCDAK